MKSTRNLSNPSLPLLLAFALTARVWEPAYGDAGASQKAKAKKRAKQ